MTRNFPSLGAFAAHLAKAAVAERLALEAGLERAAAAIEKTAREELGTYQPSVGPFPAWEDLAESTVERRTAAGFTPDDPLLASGDMRETFGHERKGFEAVAGSTDEKMVFHEFGTSKMPARPVWGPAAVKNQKRIKRLLGSAAVAGIVGGAVVHPSLGYDFNVGDP